MCGSRASCCPHTSMTGTCCIPCRCRRCRRRPCLRRCAIRRRIREASVRYRDPLGVISPSGEWLAYSIAYRLFVQRLVGGPVTELPPSTANIRHLAWLPDDRTLVVDSGDSRARWWSYDTATGKRHPLWPDTAQTIPLAKLEQLTWSADGRKVAGVVRTASGTELWI